MRRMSPICSLGDPGNRGNIRHALGLSVIALALAGIAGARSSVQRTAQTAREIVVRKNVTRLTPIERKEFVTAVVALKAASSPFNPALNYYDQFVQWHKDRYVCHGADHGGGMPMVHAGPMFLP